jgi:TetR/AcrR family transcriptional regulator, cholesterol catabolism regulator
MSAEAGRRARRKQETHARILDAAVACFAERGFEETTMQAIAERADVARATVFNHFPDKQALLNGYLDRRRARLAELLQAGKRTNAGAAQTLQDAFALLSDENERDPAETRELARAWLRAGGNATAGTTELIFAAMVATGQERGELRADIDAELAGRLLFDAYVGVVIRWAAAGPPRFPLKPALRQVAVTILHGLHR